jgi:hypothetical protein
MSPRTTCRRFLQTVATGTGVLAAWDHHPARARAVPEEKPPDYPYTHELTVQAASPPAGGLPSDS